MPGPRWLPRRETRGDDVHVLDAWPRLATYLTTSCLLPRDFGRASRRLATSRLVLRNVATLTLQRHAWTVLVAAPGDEGRGAMARMSWTPGDVAPRTSQQCASYAATSCLDRAGAAPWDKRQRRASRRESYLEMSCLDRAGCRAGGREATTRISRPGDAAPRTSQRRASYLTTSCLDRAGRCTGGRGVMTSYFLDAL